MASKRVTGAQPEAGQDPATEPTRGPTPELTAAPEPKAGPTRGPDAAPGDEAEPLRRLKEGDIAPDFALLDQDGQTVSLPQFRGRRVVLYFYPAAMTPGCTTQADDFRDNLSELEAAGIAVLGLSPDGVAKLAKFRDREGLTFPLLSDPERSALMAFGAYGEKSMYGKKVMGVIRSTFVVGPDGHIEKAMYNVKATGHVAKLMRELGVGTA